MTTSNELVAEEVIPSGQNTQNDIQTALAYEASRIVAKAAKKDAAEEGK